MVQDEEKMKAGVANLSQRVFLSGALSLVVIGLTTWFTSNYMKNFFRYKKII